MSGLEQEFPGKVKAANESASTDEAKKIIRELGFVNHGLVVRAPDGTVLHKEADHSVKIDEVRKAIRELLKL